MENVQKGIFTRDEKNQFRAVMKRCESPLQQSEQQSSRVNICLLQYGKTQRI